MLGARKRFQFIVVMTLLLTISAGAYYLSSPPNDTRRFLTFTVLPGESYKSVSLRLSNEGLVRSEPFFYYLGRLTGRSGKLKHGEYELNNHMSAWEVLNVVTGTSVKLYRVVIPEGTNMFQIAKMLDDMDLVDQTQFLEAAWDRSFIGSLHIPSPTVEGYLFPETYYIPRGTSAKAIIRMFVDMFWSRIPEDYLEQAKKNPLTFHEAVTLAGMIEEETGLAGEMGIISSVFHNRLKKRMRLQSDPTAIYDTKPLDAKVTRKDLFRKTPFNTYQIRGLPLSPTSNPGILAIHAALFPQKSDYLYFVSRRDGSHYFSKTYKEHEKAIDRFLR